MDYTLHQLKVFVEVVKQESVTKAAEALFLTQPAVSIQLRKFQDQFPMPLTEVIGRKLFVTDFGREIAQKAGTILAAVDSIAYRTMEYQGKTAGKISFSVVSTGKYVMPYYLAGFVEKYPSVDYSMDVTNRSVVLRHLEENKIDFALVSVLPETFQVERIPLITNSLHLVGSGSRINRDKASAKTIFESRPLLFREKGSATRKSMEALLSALGVTVNKKLELTSNEAVKQALIAGLGYSIMPKIGIKDALDKGKLEIVEAPGLPINTQWNLVWLRSKKLSLAAQAYVEYIRCAKEQIRETHFSWV